MSDLENFDTFDLWCEKMWRFGSPMKVLCEDPKNFRGFSKSWELGDFGVTFFSAPPYQAEQTDSEMHKAQRKRLVLTIPTRGSCDFNQYGRHVDLAPGEAAFHVTKAPLTYRQTEQTTVWLFSIPLHRALMHVDDPEEVCAIRMFESMPGFRTVKEFLTTLPSDFPLVSDAVRDALAVSAVDMICALLMQLRGEQAGRRSQTARQRLRQIKWYIDQHLGVSVVRVIGPVGGLI